MSQKDEKEEEKGEEVVQEKEETMEAGGDESSGPILDMPDGEYQLHVLVENGKYIILEGEDMVDPLIEIKWCGKNKKTSTKKNVSATTVAKWDEHIFLDSGKVEKSFIEDSWVELKILNYGFFKAETIGFYSISSANLYKMNSKVNDSHKHVFHNQPISFTNPDADDKSKITAAFTLSMNL